MNLLDTAMSPQTRFSDGNWWPGDVSTIPFPHAEAAMFGRLLAKLRPAWFRMSVYRNYWHVFPTSQG
jgi:hypothetical protein